ncbi:MAG: AI-2E family transporter [Paludibacterium sp.]|uniref:AI-2E family transporter n=1 Tax=Paludibacterium sp. TaxID=1917523 RepID=UPI0025E6B97E|nr:AI-2E family transporter [Paludibacterium sp.]MBV8049297.1 AI-2E family transporter [Paludibacterium sp.]MBV8648428.1 AI-2E family transporter [Paludibacterium sp.]
MLAKSWSNISVMAVMRVAVVLLLIFACYRIVQPFLGALIWAVIIAVSVWPAYNWLVYKLNNRRRLAAVLIIGAIALAIAAPIGLMILSLGDLWPFLSQIARGLSGYHLPNAPAWLLGMPVVGEPFGQVWRSAQSDLPAMLAKLMPAINRGALWSLSYGAQLALSLFEIVLSLVVATLLLINGEHAWHVAENTIVKLGGAPATELPDVVSRTIRGVTTGVIGTALVQTLLCVIGLLIAGVPAPVVLGFLCFMLAVAQLPTLLVWLPAALWVFYTGHSGLALFLALWGFLLVNTIDNFIKPLLISQGAKLPLSLIFIGVIGGLLAWGMIGLFIGPTLLAVSYTLFVYWLRGDETLPPGV